LVRIFNRPIGKGFRAVGAEFAMAYVLGLRGMAKRTDTLQVLSNRSILQWSWDRYQSVHREAAIRQSIFTEVRNHAKDCFDTMNALFNQEAKSNINKQKSDYDS